MTETLRAYVPGDPIALDQVVERFPAIRQSTLSAFDDCALSAYFDLSHGQLWSTHPQGRGTIFHRTIAECLRTMRHPHRMEDTIPVSEALEILHETLRQERIFDPELGDYRPLEPEEIVRVPVRQISELRRFVSKFARDNSFDIEKIVDVERRLSATVRYPDANGEIVERVLTGQIDCLMYRPPVKQGERPGALVIDWKDTWGLPPDHSDVDEDDGSGLSWHGYFQQRFYAWLIMRNYPKVMQVTLREFYIRHTVPRPATVTRERLHLIEQELAILAQQFDAAVGQGKPPWPYKLETVGRWKPSPGKHCGFCLRPGQCPIEEESRGEGALSSQAGAERYAAELEVVERVRDHRLSALKVWCEAHGPVPVRWAKGRMMAMWKPNKTGSGRRFGIHPAPVSDRTSKQERAVDEKLVAAARESAHRARLARRKRP